MTDSARLELEREVARAVLEERERCAMVAQLYPVHQFADEPSEALRIRDNISEAIRKGLKPTQPIP